MHRLAAQGCPLVPSGAWCPAGMSSAHWGIACCVLVPSGAQWFPLPDGASCLVPTMDALCPMVPGGTLCPLRSGAQWCLVCVQNGTTCQVVHSAY